MLYIGDLELRRCDPARRYDGGLCVGSHKWCGTFVTYAVAVVVTSDRVRLDTCRLVERASDQWWLKIVLTHPIIMIAVVSVLVVSASSFEPAA